MKYLIKIDRKSIKKNPDAGRTSYTMPCGAPTTSFRIDAPHDSLESDCIVVQSFNFNADSGHQFESAEYVVGGMSGDDMFTLFTGLANCYGEKFSNEITFPHVEINSIIPEPRYLFEYEVMEVTCRICNQKVDTDDLINDYDEYGSSIHTCPKCGGDCCELEHERIEDVIKEIK